MGTKKNSMPTKVDQKDRQYVEKAAKLCSFFVNIDELYIEIPEGSEPDMTALHLKNTRGFQLRYVLPDACRAKTEIEFKPAPFVHKVKKTGGLVEPDYKPVERFKTREGWFFNLVSIKSNGELEFAWLDRMKANFAVSKLTASINVKHKVWVYLGKEDGQSRR